MDTAKQVFLDLNLFSYIRPALLTFIFTMAMVYGFGRILSLVKTSIGKNRVAILSCIVFGPLLILRMVPQVVEDCLMVACIGIILYTLIGMRLFSRVDSFQDAKLGSDSEPGLEEIHQKPKGKRTKK